VYTEEGYWYDAIASVSQLADADPDNLALRAQLADLLRHEQVSLHEAAACAR